MFKLIQKKTTSTPKQKFKSLAESFTDEQLLTWFTKALENLPTGNYPEAFFIGALPHNYQPYLELPTIFYEKQAVLEFSCASIVPCLNLMIGNEGEPQLSLLSSTRQQTAVMMYLYNPHEQDFIPLKKLTLNHIAKSILIEPPFQEQPAPAQTAVTLPAPVYKKPEKVTPAKRTGPEQQKNGDVESDRIKRVSSEGQMEVDNAEDVSTEEESPQSPDTQPMAIRRPYITEVHDLVQLIQTNTPEATLITTARTILEHHPHHNLDYLSAELAHRGIALENLLFLFSLQPESFV